MNNYEKNSMKEDESHTNKINTQNAYKYTNQETSKIDNCYIRNRFK